MNRQLAPLFILACLSSTLIACGGGGSSTPPPPPPSISVSYSTAPPTSLNVNGTAPIAVTVTNDTANAGVTFSCLPSGSCGTFTNITAMSATYNAPAVAPSGGSVTIIATSVKDSTKTAQKTVTINGALITVLITSPVPAVLQTGATVNLIAQLTNDTTNAGVTWSCTPGGSPTCGTFTNVTPTTATFTAPTPPAGGTIAIVATSAAQPSSSSSVGPIGIEGVASLASLKGQYAFLVLSPTGSRGTATWVGSVSLDGAGNLAAVGTTTFAGVEDVVAPGRNDQGDNIYPTSANSASKYTVDPSGHGQITMATVMGELLTISFVITSGNSSGVATHAEIIEADGNGGEDGDPGSGTLDLQDPTAFSNSSLANTYSFTMTGVQNDIAQTLPPESLGGVLDLSAPAAISGSVDIVSGGAAVSSAAGQGSKIDNAPDANGRGTFHVVLPGASTTRSITYYVVSSKVLRVFENSNVSFTGGSMYSQGSSATALAGSYVYQHSGWSSAGRTIAVGQFITRANALSGISDANSGGLSTITPATGVSVLGTFSNPALPTIQIGLDDAAGVNNFNAYPVDPTVNILDPNNPTGRGGALLLHTDSNINGVGILLPQSSPQVFSSSYALNLVNAIAATTPNEVDLVGILSSDGDAIFAGATNLADYTQNSGPNPMLNAPLSGTFTTPAATGRSTASFSVTSLANGYSFPTGTATTTPTKSTFNVAIYQASSSQAFVVETDNQAIAAGQMIQQNLP